MRPAGGPHPAISKLGAPHLAFECQVSTHPLHSVSGHPLHCAFLVWGFDPAFDDRRTLDRRVDFADEGGAEEDQESIFDRLDHDTFSSQGFADSPAVAMQV